MPSRTDLELLIENRSTLLAECLERVEAGEFGGGLYFDICFHYRSMGIAHLLLEGDARRYVDCLARSGQVRRHYLEHADRTAASDPEFLCTSSDRGWEAAMVAGDLEGARLIARLLSETLVPGHEYPEDFLFRRLLHQLPESGGEGGFMAEPAALSSLEAVASETSPAKAAIVRGLLERDAERYIAGLTDWLERRHARFVELAATPGFSREHLATERHVFVLGLAVDRIAGARGLPQPDLFGLPALARSTGHPASCASDSWRQFVPHDQRFV